ncbi:MAG: hypothetical protein LIO77_02940 [Rikenellaceae bacterium]|nr:hypothetical protein [Rikenellaceae bacterium]
MRILKITLVLLNLIVAFPIFAALPDLSRTINVDTKFFEGRWIAQKDNLSWEIEFVRRKVNYSTNVEPDFTIDGLWGGIKYKNNGQIIRESGIDSDDVRIQDYKAESPYSIYFHISDCERLVRGGFDFIIDQNDPKKAVLKFGPKRPLMGWNEDDYDIPDGMTWTKVE